MPEAYPIETHFAPTYAANIQMLLQQTTARLLPCVEVGYHSGEKASVVDQIGSLNMQQRTGRLTAIEFSEASAERRWVSPTPYHLAQPCDDYDKLRTVVDPMSTYVRTGAAAARRQIDATISSAFFGTAKTGKDGTSTTAFPAAGNTVAVTVGAAAATGMNLTKLIEAIRVLMGNEALDMIDAGDMICCAVTSKQWEDMMGDYRLTSDQYRSMLPVESAEIGRPLGVNFVRYENLPTDTNGYRRCPVWVKSGMHFAWFKEISTSIDQRTDLVGRPWQIYQEMIIDCTRVEENKVLEVLCSES